MTVKDFVNGNEPWWAKLVMTVGAPLAILSFVIYVTFSGMAANAQAAATNSQQTVEVVSELKKVTQELAASSRRMEYYEWVKCIRSSRTETERIICGPKPREI